MTTLVPGLEVWLDGTVPIEFKRFIYDECDDCSQLWLRPENCHNICFVCWQIGEVGHGINQEEAEALWACWEGEEWMEQRRQRYARGDQQADEATP